MRVFRQHDVHEWEADGDVISQVRIVWRNRRPARLAHGLESFPLMYARDLMQRDILTLAPSDTLDFADDIMRLGCARHLPVVASGEVVGILSQRDLLRAAASSALGFERRHEQQWLARILVAAVMTSAVVVVSPETSIRTAVDLMLERRIGCLPVVEGGRLIGLLTETDCLRYLVRVLNISRSNDGICELARSS